MTDVSFNKKGNYNLIGLNLMGQGLLRERLETIPGNGSEQLGEFLPWTTMAESRSNRAAIQATNDDASASKLYATSSLLVLFSHQIYI